MSRLVVVSNRVAPPRKKKSGAEGGLAVAVHAALKARGGIWFGWSGQVTDHEPDRCEVFEVGNVSYATLDLLKDDFERYYNGYSNRTLWPLFHYRLDLSDFSRNNLAGYMRVNQLFASRLYPLLDKDDQIWVHDYQLIPLGEQLRNAGCKQRIGFFLHIPWPAVEVFLTLPNHREIVSALAAYDLVGFQTDTDYRAFVDYVIDEARGKVLDNGMLEVFGRRFRAGAFPIGVDTENVAQFARENADTPTTNRLRESLRDRDLVLGVDRLDYSKGLLSRLEALDHLLAKYPDNRGRVTLMQIAPPSRAEVPEYIELRQQIETLAGHINGLYADFDWQPIRYLNKGFKRQTLAGFFRVARIGLVTPLRDGMNLVAKEYVAAQDPEDPGVLLLSRFAGAARELDAAVIVNPYDTEGMAEAMQVALAMPLEERKARWKKLYKHISKHDVSAWRESFLDTLAATER